MALEWSSIPSFLAGHFGSPAEVVSSPVPITGGVENRNFLVIAQIGKRVHRLILRCPPEVIPQWRRADGLYDLHREFRVLQELEKLGFDAPRALCYDGGAHFGVPCLLMEALPGEPLNPSSFDVEVSIDSVADVFDRIRLVPWERSDWLAQNLPRWPSHRALASLDRNVVANARDQVFDAAWQWLNEHLPATREWSFGHGDLNLGNILCRSGRITGVVDWEFACLRDDPLEEIGFYPWLYGDEVARELTQAVCKRLHRAVSDALWFTVRSWTGFTYGNPAHPMFDERRERLSKWIKSANGRHLEP